VPAGMFVTGYNACSMHFFIGVPDYRWFRLHGLPIVLPRDPSAMRRGNSLPATPK